MRALKIDGREHEIRPPASAVERIEMHDAFLLYTQQPGGTVRGAAILFFAMTPTLRPPRVVWSGTNAAEVGRAMVDHLLGIGLGVHDIEEIAAQSGIYEALRDSLPPTRAKVAEAVKNS